MCTECQNQPVRTIPESWYDLASRITSTQAVAVFILEAMPFGSTPEEKKAAQCAVGLASAVIDLLEMCQKDCERLELEIKSANP